MDFLENIVTLPFAIMALSAIAAFATVMTIALPALSRDRTSARMKIMATERDKMRSQRITELQGTKGSKLRTAPKGFVSQIVQQLNLREAFETDEVKNKLKMAGLRGQAPVVMFVFFRFAAPIIMAVGTFAYLFTINDFGMVPFVRLGVCVVAAYLGLYLPNIFISNLIQRRQQSISNAFPDALDLLLICVQSGMSTEAAFGKVAKEVTNQSLDLGEEFHLTTAELSYLSDRRQAFENLGKRDMDERVEWALSRAAIWNEVKDKLSQSGQSLSGGQQQRLCIARGIAIKPDVLLLDEPCSALDPISTAKVEELIHELKTDYTVVIVTHNMQQAARVSDYTAYMYLGELIEYDVTDTIFIKPKKAATEDYITGRFG